ncbi:hypothetical protein CAEBREN_13985 [Caenorhabditis brenneri]|uniref:F-box domain-containing protein n=1 Tax=Caenorhabditis brenneri TaxID=135651 RepID=G0MF22_CAEBE|nr:hypothetical protein CAEBREN_13985 [Caenorhabditis brenneri]
MNFDLRFEKKESSSVFYRQFEKWNCLPEELKLECMKPMDLKTRFCLRRTSKTEHRLVNSQRFDLCSIDFDEESDGFIRGSITDKSYHNTSSRFRFRRSEDMARAISFFSFLFQNANINCFGNNCDVNALDFLTCMNVTSPYRIKTFMGTISPKLIQFFEKCADNSFNQISFVYGDKKPFPVKDLIQCKCLDSVKKWRMGGRNAPDLGHEIVRKWIEIDVDIGSSQGIQHYGTETVDDFVSELTDYEM